MRKVIYCLVVVVLLAGLVLGCAKPAPAPAPAPAPTPAPAPKPAPKPAPAPAPAPTPAPKPGEIDRSITMPKFLTIMGGTSPTSSSTIKAAAFKVRLEADFPEMDVRRMPGGTIDSAIKANTGETDIGVCSGPVPGWAWRGVVDFKEPQQNIRNLFITDSPKNSVSLFVLKDSPIKTAADLWNKRIHVGSKTSFSKSIIEAGLMANGITYESIEKNGGLVAYGSPKDGAEGLAEGDFDAVGYGVFHPYAAWTQVDVARGIRPLWWSEQEVASITSNVPGMEPTINPGGLYSGAPKPWRSVRIISGYVVGIHVPEDVVYNIMASLLDKNHPEGGVLDSLSGGKEMDLWSLNGNPKLVAAPFHPGSVRYFQEIGILPADYKWQSPY